MLSNKNRYLLLLTTILIVLISIQYVLQLSHASLFVIKNYILQCSIILLLQIAFFYLKKEYPDHQSSILRINLVTTTTLVLIFVSIYPLDFPIKEIISVIIGLIILGFMFVHKEFDAYNFPGHEAGKMTVIIISICTLIGIFLRIYKLGDLPIMVDELTHLNQAKDILAGRPIIYTRSLIPITLPITLIIKYLPSPLYWGRVYCVLLNLAAVIPLYFLLKQIDYRIGWLSVFLFATSPWMVFRSQMIREYAYLPVMIYAVLFLFTRVFELFREISTHQESIKSSLLKHKGIYIGFFLITFYIFIVDRQSILLTTLGLYGLFLGAILLIIFSYSKLRKYWWISLIVLIIFTLIGILVIKITAPTLVQKIFSTDLTFRFQFLKYFLNNSISQWYYKSPVIFWPAIVVLSTFLLIKTNKKLLVAFLFSSFILYFILFAVLLPEYSKPRYATFAEILFLPLYAFGLASCIILIYSTFNKRYLLLATIISILIGTSFYGIYSYLSRNIWNLEGKQITDGYVHPVTEENLYGFEKVDRYFEGRDIHNSVLVSSFYGNYVQFTGKPLFTKSIFIHFTDKNFEALLSKAITTNRNGYYVVDDSRLVNPGFQIQQVSYCPTGEKLNVQSANSPCENQLNFVGKYGRFFVWHWSD